MSKRNATVNYNTNLASEYLMMSLLCRAGKDAYLSLGNKKGVDIMVNGPNGGLCIVEVKGVNKRNDWIIGNSGHLPVADNLYYALICFHGKISDLTSPGDFWIIPSIILKATSEHKIASNNKTVFISNKRIRENYSDYLNTLKWLDQFLETKN